MCGFVVSPAPASAAITITPATDAVSTPMLSFDFGGPGGDVERVDLVQWRGSKGTLGPNLVDNGGSECVAGDPSDSWGRADSVAGQPDPVGDGTTGTWTPRGERTVEINSLRSEGCSGETPATAVRTRYTFFEGAGDEVRVERRFSFSALSPNFGGDGFRAYVPALPAAYEEVLYPSTMGSLEKAHDTTVGHSTLAEWNETWFALNEPASDAGVVILRDPADQTEAQLELERTDAGNSTSAELLQPMGGWDEPVTETEYLCFYDAESWPLQLRTAKTPPSGCAPALVPIDDSPPAIEGEARAGTTLTATTGTWDNAAAFSYQWTRCMGAVCGAILGATGVTYTPVTADEGKQLRVDVTATAAGGEADTASSELTNGVKPGPPAAPLAPVEVSAPVVSGEARETETLTVSTGEWDWAPTRYQYQWLRCASASGTECAELPGATSSSYTLQHADSGSTMRARVTAINAVGPTSTTTAPTGIVQPLTLRAHFAISPSTVCTNEQIVIDGRSSQTPNPPITRYTYSYIERPRLSPTEYEEKGYPRMTVEADEELWENPPSYELASGPSALTTASFTWNRLDIELIEPFFFVPFVPVRDPVVITLTVTDASGAKASYSYELDFIDGIDIYVSTSGCPRTNVSQFRKFVFLPPGPPKVTSTTISSLVHCATPAPCAGAISILAAGSHAASATKHAKAKANAHLLASDPFFSIPGHRKATVRARLTKLGRAQLRRGGRVRAIIQLTSYPGVGQSVTRSYHVTLRRK